MKLGCQQCGKPTFCDKPGHETITHVAKRESSFLDDLAFDRADAYCKCKEGELCDSQPFMDGFKAGI